MTNEPAPAERRRRSRAKPTTPLVSAAGDAATTVVDAGVAPVKVAASSSIPRSIFSSPLTAASAAAPRTAPPAVHEVSAQPVAESNEAAAVVAEAPERSRPARGRRRRAEGVAVDTAAEPHPGAVSIENVQAPTGKPEPDVMPAAARAPRRGRSRAAASTDHEGKDTAASESGVAPLAVSGEEARGSAVGRPPERGAPVEEPRHSYPVAGSAGTTDSANPTSGRELSWGAGPASDYELAAIARASGAPSARRPEAAPGTDVPVAPFPDEEEMVTWTPASDQEDDGLSPRAESDETGEWSDEPGGPRRRRRRGRGRRGGAGRGTPQSVGEDELTEAAEETDRPVRAQGREQVPAREPLLPSYPVEFEPTPPPTKRRPARRPGMSGDPRFSPEEQAEVDQFVRLGPSTPSHAPAVQADQFRASLLTVEEEREMAQVAPARRRSRRGRGGKETVEAAADTGLEPTPAFEPMPVSPAGRAGQNPLEALLGRQNVILDTLMERQISLLRNIERSLIALDQRLSHSPQGLTSVPRAGVFVDVPNVIYAAERIGCTIDFGKLLALLTKGRELVRASAYAPVSDDPQMRLESQKFVQPFVGRGYRIVTKPLKRFADGTMKGNFDVELAMDILTMADRLDVVCLVSGDGDFSRLVEIIAGKGVRVEVVAFSGSTSSELRATCDEYIDLGTRLREICS